MKTPPQTIVPATCCPWPHRRAKRQSVAVEPRTRSSWLLDLRCATDLINQTRRRFGPEKEFLARPKASTRNASACLRLRFRNTITRRAAQGLEALSRTAS